MRKLFLGVLSFFGGSEEEEEVGGEKERDMRRRRRRGRSESNRMLEYEVALPPSVFFRALLIGNRMEPRPGMIISAPLETIRRAAEGRCCAEENGLDGRRGPTTGDDDVEIARLLPPASAATIAAGRVPMAEAETRRCI